MFSRQRLWLGVCGPGARPLPALQTSAPRTPSSLLFSIRACHPCAGAMLIFCIVPIITGEPRRESIAPSSLLWLLRPASHHDNVTCIHIYIYIYIYIYKHVQTCMYLFVYTYTIISRRIILYHMMYVIACYITTASHREYNVERPRIYIMC